MKYVCIHLVGYNYFGYFNDMYSETCVKDHLSGKKHTATNDRFGLTQGPGMYCTHI